jgi:hypothetical protein
MFGSEGRVSGTGLVHGIAVGRGLGDGRASQGCKSSDSQEVFHHGRQSDIQIYRKDTKAIVSPSDTEILLLNGQFQPKSDNEWTRGSACTEPSRYRNQRANECANGITRQKDRKGGKATNSRVSLEIKRKEMMEKRVLQQRSSGEKGTPR